MKICLLVDSPTWGGLERHAVALASALSQEGHAVVFGATDAVTEELFRPHLPSGVAIENLNLGRPSGRAGFRASLRALRLLDCDSVALFKGCHDTGNLALDVAARLAASRYVHVEELRAARLPRISRRYVAGLVPGLGLWWRRKTWRARLRSEVAHSTVCVSEAVRERLITDYWCAARKLKTVANGSDMALFRFSTDHRRRLRTGWGIPDSAVVFGAAARLSEIKRFDVVIRSLHALEQAQPDRDVRLVLAGDGPERAALTEMAAAMLKRPAVFVGQIERPEEFLSALDVFTLSSAEEGLPFALVEAMACERCVIATAVGGVHEVLADANYGMLVPSGNQDAYDGAVRHAFAIGDIARRRMGMLARQRVNEHFNAAKQLRALAGEITGGVTNRAIPHAGSQAMAS